MGSATRSACWRSTRSWSARPAGGVSTPSIIINGLIVVAVAALIGGRLYHVIDQWALYKDDPITILLPIRRAPDGGYVFAGFSGLGVYGGLLTGTIAAWPVHPLEAASRSGAGRTWSAPALFAMQAIGRLGQLLQPGAVRAADDAAVGDRDPVQEPGRGLRLPARLGPERDARASTSSRCSCTSPCRRSSGCVFLLWLGRRFADRLRTGDLLLVFFIWYSITRFLLEFLRAGYNWTLGGIPTAQIVAGITIVLAG